MFHIPAHKNVKNPPAQKDWDESVWMKAEIERYQRETLFIQEYEGLQAELDYYRGNNHEEK